MSERPCGLLRDWKITTHSLREGFEKRNQAENTMKTLLFETSRSLETPLSKKTNFSFDRNWFQRLQLFVWLVCGYKLLFFGWLALVLGILLKCGIHVCCNDHLHKFRSNTATSTYSWHMDLYQWINFKFCIPVRQQQPQIHWNWHGCSDLGWGPRRKTGHVLQIAHGSIESILIMEL